MIAIMLIADRPEGTTYAALQDSAGLDLYLDLEWDWDHDGIRVNAVSDDDDAIAVIPRHFKAFLDSDLEIRRYVKERWMEYWEPACLD